MRHKTMLAAGFAMALGACTEDGTQPLAGPDPDQSPSVQSQALIAFSSSREGDAEIYTMSRKGKKVTRLTDAEGLSSTPAWSPDRSRIAFTTFGASGGSDIYVMNSDGTEVALIATNARAPDWSPDGSKIAFVRDGAIVISNADGTSQETLPHEASDNDDEPDWSPDGTRLVITRDRGFTQLFDLWVIDADGSNPIQLTSNPTTQEVNAAWSPDGSKIAFAADLAGPAFQIFVIGADASSQVQLTAAGFNFQPSWSPEGDQIAFTSFRDGNSEVYTMDSDGTRETRLTNDPASDEAPAWAP